MVEIARDNELSGVIASPMLLARDGHEARIHRGQRTPIPRREARDTAQGQVVQTVGYEYQETGLSVNCLVRELGANRVGLEVMGTVSEIIGVSAEGSVPITAEATFESTVAMTIGGVYLLAEVEEVNTKTGRLAGLHIGRRNDRSERTMQI